MADGVNLIVRIINVPASCCGVLCSGYTSMVLEAVVLDEERTIYILENGVLVWESDTEEVTEVH